MQELRAVEKDLGNRGVYVGRAGDKEKTKNTQCGLESFFSSDDEGLTDKRFAQLKITKQEDLYAREKSLILQDETACAVFNVYSLAHPLIQEGVKKYCIEKSVAHSSSIVVTARPVVSMGTNSDGSLRLELTSEPRLYPLLLTFPLNKHAIPDWDRHAIAEQVHLNSRVACMNLNSLFFGRVGKVQSMEGGVCQVEFDVSDLVMETNFPKKLQTETRELLVSHGTAEQWHSFKDVADLLSQKFGMVIKEAAVRLLASQFLVSEVRSQSGFPSRENLGLNFVLFSANKNTPFTSPGLARCRWKTSETGGRWNVQLSITAVEAFEEYAMHYPFVFELANSIAGAKKSAPPSAKHLFENASDPNYELGLLASWLSKRSYRRGRLVPATHCVAVSKKTITSVCELVDRRFAKFWNSDTRHVVTVSLREHELRSCTSVSPVPQSLVPPEPVIGQRVMFAKAEGAVPFGSYGTIIGVLGARVQKGAVNVPAKSEDENADETVETLVEVVLDKPFLGASDLFGRCPSRRGILCSPDDLLAMLPLLNTMGVVVKTVSYALPTTLSVKQIQCLREEHVDMEATTKDLPTEDLLDQEEVVGGFQFLRCTAKASTKSFEKHKKNRSSKNRYPLLSAKSYTAPNPTKPQADGSVLRDIITQKKPAESKRLANSIFVPPRQKAEKPDTVAPPVAPPLVAPMVSKDLGDQKSLRLQQLIFKKGGQV